MDQIEPALPHVVSAEMPAMRENWAHCDRAIAPAPGEIYGAFRFVGAWHAARYASGRDVMMNRTEDMLRLMEVGIGVREAVFVTTGILPLGVAESSRAEYEHDIRLALQSYPVEWKRPEPSIRLI